MFFEWSKRGGWGGGGGGGGGGEGGLDAPLIFASLIMAVLGQAFVHPSLLETSFCPLANFEKIIFLEKILCARDRLVPELQELYTYIYRIVTMEIAM